MFICGSKNAALSILKSDHYYRTDERNDIFCNFDYFVKYDLRYSFRLWRSPDRLFRVRLLLYQLNIFHIGIRLNELILRCCLIDIRKQQARLFKQANVRDTDLTVAAAVSSHIRRFA